MPRSPDAKAAHPRYPDPHRIYANGLSNGGGMSYALACELSDRIAVIGAVSGAYLLPWTACEPTWPIPAILFHGTGDPVVPYQGGPSRAFDMPFPHIPTWIAELARRNGCEDAPRGVPAGEAVHGVAYNDCAADIVFYAIDGGGHSWPGGVPLPEAIAGATTDAIDAIDATRLMWDFFAAHPLHE